MYKKLLIVVFVVGFSFNAWADTLDCDGCVDTDTLLSDIAPVVENLNIDLLDHFIGIEFDGVFAGEYDIIKALELALDHLEDPGYQKPMQLNKWNSITLLDVQTPIPSEIDIVESELKELNDKRDLLKKKSEDIQYIKETLRALKGE